MKVKAWTEELPPLPTNGILDPLLIDPLGRTRLKKLKTRPWTPGEKKPQVGAGNQEKPPTLCEKFLPFKNVWKFCRSIIFLGGWIRGLKDKFVFFFGGGGGSVG